jgi:LacI family transcriptional regulator
MEAHPRVILLIPLAREFDRGIRRGIVQYANAHGAWIFYEDPPAYLQGQDYRLLRTQWNADGMIVLQGRLREVKRLHLPTVVFIVTRSVGNGLCQLIGDDERIGQMGADALLALGVRQFAYCGLRGLEFSEVRGKAFAAAIKRAGYPAYSYQSPLQPLGKSWYTKEQYLADWLSALPKPIGLLACNDDLARVLVDVCHIKSIQVPDQIAILGVDNDEQLCTSASPPLSSIALATERAGYEVAALLTRLMSNPKMQPETVVVCPTHIVSRQSTDVLAVKDPSIVRALRFIRANAANGVPVTEVAKIAGLSRRKLQDRFKECLSVTPIEEINRCRVAHIANLLLETNLPISEIAEAGGFNVDAHVARFFSRHTGLTPLAFRKTHRIS